MHCCTQVVRTAARAAGPGERRNGKSGLEGGSEGDSEGGGGG